MSIPTKLVRRKDRSQSKDWWARWYDRRTGSMKWRNLGPNKALARQKLNQLQRLLALGKDVSLTDERITLREFTERHYIPDYLSDENRSWHSKQKQFLRDYILPALGNKMLVDIDSYSVEAWYNRMLSKYSDKTCHLVLNSLRTLLRRAVRGGFITQSPVINEVKPRTPGRKIPTYLTKEQIEYACQHLEGFDRIFFMLWLTTGLRLGEAQWLQWGDLDFKHQRLYVREKPGHRIKDNEDRVIPLLPGIINELKLFADNKSKDDFVYPSPVKDRPIKYFSNTVKNLFRKAGLNGSALIFRHTFASLFLSGGGALGELKAYLGHSSIALTERHYAAFIPPKRSTIYEIDFGVENLTSNYTRAIPKGKTS